MSNKKLILKLINQFLLYVNRLKELRTQNKDVTKKAFTDNWQLEWKIDRGLQLAIECAIAIGQEIVGVHGWRKPESYKDVFMVLQSNKVIDYDLCEELQELAAFRNRLVHEYLFLDRKQIYDIWQKKLSVLENFLRVISKLVK